MSLIDVVLLAIALGIDCFVASFSQGLIFNMNRLKNSLTLALVMGVFQGGMPVIGYIGADYIYNLLVPFSKWITFGIFLILGVKFIVESFLPKGEEIQCIGLRCLMGLGIATSIDALVSGASLRLTGANLLIAGLVIGFVSFLMSLGGFWLGNFIKKIPSRYLEIAGGVILILLAVKAIL